MTGAHSGGQSRRRSRVYLGLQEQSSPIRDGCSRYMVQVRQGRRRACPPLPVGKTVKLLARPPIRCRILQSSDCRRSEQECFHSFPMAAAQMRMQGRGAVLPMALTSNPCVRVQLQPVRLATLRHACERHFREAPTPHIQLVCKHTNRSVACFASGATRERFSCSRS